MKKIIYPLVLLIVIATSYFIYTTVLEKDIAIDEANTKINTSNPDQTCEGVSDAQCEAWWDDYNPPSDQGW